MTFANDGFELLQNFISEDLLQTLLREIAPLSIEDIKAGLRNADKKLPAVHQFAHSPLVIEKASEYLCGHVALVRAILFDKNPDHNWLVTWHQDRTVCVSQRADIRGWGPWTIKDQAIHVQPPLEVLNQMVTFRLHLDNAHQHNGCLRVIPGSHREGLLTSEQIRTITHHQPATVCDASAGSLLVMRPHLLHASSKSTSMTRRRVIHLEYSSYQLPAGLSWA
jgi:ectoine hydroxylase-related dioxygenase (phytanoyl-CoA dioxygenase family)